MKISIFILFCFIFIHDLAHGQLKNNTSLNSRLDSIMNAIKMDTYFTYLYPQKAQNYWFIEIDSISNKKSVYISLKKSIVSKKKSGYMYSFPSKILKKCKFFKVFENKKIPVFFTSDMIFFSKKIELSNDGKFIGFTIHKATNKVERSYVY